MVKRRWKRPQKKTSRFIWMRLGTLHWVNVVPNAPLLTVEFGGQKSTRLSRLPAVAWNLTYLASPKYVSL